MIRSYAAVFVASAMLAGSASSAAAQQASAGQAPRFRTNVDLLPIDVSVIDGQGRPVLDLTADDFTVVIEGTRRRVATAEWIPLRSIEKRSAAEVPEGYTSNENATGGRLIVLVVDQPNIGFRSTGALVSAVGRFLDRLTPSDRVAAVGLGVGARSTPFTGDHDRIKQALGRMIGQRQSNGGDSFAHHGIDPGTAAEIIRGNEVILEMLVNRDCPSDRAGGAQEVCRVEIIEEATSLLHGLEQEADATIHGLRALLLGLRSMDAPKTIVLVSEGFVLHDVDGETVSRLAELGSLAAAARTGMYILQLDDQLFNVTASVAVVKPLEDRRLRTQGLQTLAGAARGAWFPVAGTGDGIFDRIEAELSGYYLVAVETDASDVGKKPRSLRVDVSRKGAIVRSRRMLLATSRNAETGPPSSREAVAAALTTPLTMSGLPLRAISFSLQGPDPTRVQALINVDIGSGYTAPQSIAVGYLIIDGQDRIVDSQSFLGRLTPAVSGIASALPFVAGASLLPGDYTLKLAAADGDKVGSVEHSLHASLADVGALQLSDLIVGAPASSSQLSTPTVDYTVKFGAVRGYMEAYGAAAPDVAVTYEIAAGDDTPALISDGVTGRTAGESRAVFSKVLPTTSLPPGKYRLRALVSANRALLKTVSRTFEVAAPSTSTAATSALTMPKKELFLPIDGSGLAPPFRLADALRSEVLDAFARRVPAALRTQFAEGVTQLQKGDYVAAAGRFKEAVQPDLDPTAALAYLAVSFAASGRDFEASSAWQTALVEGSDLPQIYVWLGEALLRARDLDRGRQILEEAIGRWPTDTRFARPLAVFYATTGRGYEAFRLLEQYVADEHYDAETLLMAVQWIFQTHSAGSVIHSAAEDVMLARKYADQYAKANGSKLALVKQWLAYLEKAK